ncbi:outer membrane protein assembly factor BamB family protein [Actinoplanes aureus]|uniref:PQQ-binding-like beta-propeller repeat protein n=1 Tax=Actinoplanes aureus TaxID=2792083 RepID=A0A931FWY4_9ACTN|nr:PQQ-binding-like beta-propeller repeat protein [Actinoplanes aureus]MBG0561885.1 PQQ-binding-like beta-propeller repeat protein [Actinoplanes aureus]
MTMIELGDVTAGRPAEPEADRIAPRLDRLRVRTAAAAVAGLAVLACAGSAPAAEPGVRPLWSVELASESNVSVSGDVAYVVRGGERTEVIAYTLADGARRWVRELSGRLAGFRTTSDGGPLLLSVEPGDAGTGMSRTTIALRAGTGAEIWRQPGEVAGLAVDADSTLLIRYDGRGSVMGLSRVRLTDGRPYWDRRVSSVQDVAVENDDGRPARVVTNSTRGELTVLRYADAAVLAERRIPGLVSEPAVGRYVTLFAEAGRLLVLHSDGERSYSAAYDLETLREMPRIGSAADVSYSCGVVICGHVAESLVGLDPETGRELWRYPWVAGILVIGTDRMLIDVQGDSEHLLLESRTGRLLAQDLRGSVAPDHTRDHSLLLLNPTSDPPGEISVAHLDMRTGRRTLLGSLAPVPDPQRCETVPGHVICEGPGRLVVARVPR